jgi:hypothetical protein
VQRIAVLKQQVARFSVNLNLLAAFILKPGYTLLGKAVLFLSLSLDTVTFILKGLVKLLA